MKQIYNFLGKLSWKIKFSIISGLIISLVIISTNIAPAKLSFFLIYLLEFSVLIYLFFVIEYVLRKLIIAIYNLVKKLIPYVLIGLFIIIGFSFANEDFKNYALSFIPNNVIAFNNKDSACKILLINYSSSKDCLRRLDNRHKLFLERYLQIEGNRAEGTYCKNFSAENMKEDRIIQCIEVLESNYRIAQKSKNTKERLELFAKLKDIERKEEIRQRSIDNLTNLGLSLLGYGSNTSSSSNQFTSKSLSFEDKRMNCRRTHDLYFTCRAGNERTQCFIGNPKCKNGTKFSFKDNKMKVGRNFCRYTSDGSYMCN